MPPQLKEINELDFSSPDSVGEIESLDLYEISDLDFEEFHKSKVLQRIEDRKNPDFLDLFLKEIRSSLIGRGITSFARLGEYISKKPTFDPQLEVYLNSGNIEKVKSYLENQENLKRIKQIYSINRNNRSMIEEISTSFVENLLPDYIDNVGDDRVLKIQEEVNAILESNGFEPINFDNELSLTQNLGKAIGVTAASIPYYFIGGLLTAPSRAAALAKIIKVANPAARASLNAIQNIAHTAAAFSAAEVLHSGFDPKNIMLNGVAQGSGEAVAEMALYPILSKVLGKSTAKYTTRLLANSTTEFFQELTGQYFSTGKLPDVETIGITAILSGLFSVAARRGMEVDILNVYNNAVKERERLLKKREKNPDSFTEEDLKVLNEVNNLAEAIKNNADNWRLKNKFEEFVNKRKSRRARHFEKAKERLESLSSIAGALSTELDIEGLTKDPKKLVKYLESKGFTEEEISNTPPEDILADPRFVSDLDSQNLVDYYYEIFQTIGDLQEDLTDPEHSITREDLFGSETEEELGIGITEEEIKKEVVEEIKGEIKEEVKEVEKGEEEVKEEKKKLGQDIVNSSDRDKTTLAVRWGLTLTDKQAEEVRAEIKRGNDQVTKDIEKGKEVDPNEILRLQILREALSAKTGKSINYDPETGFSEVPLEKNKLLYDIVEKVKGGETTKPKDETGIFIETGGKKIELNKQQATALNKIEKWSKGTGGVFTLSGYAGTGKTTIIKHFIDNLKGRVVVSAPTHKAVSVISKTTGQDGYTLHSLLGLQPNVDLEKFNPKNPIFAQKKKALINDYDYIIIDEASMINKELYKFLKDNYRHKRIIFIGDPAQLPPVNEAKSKVFTDVANENFYELTKVERQSETNPIFSVLDAIRSDINSTTDKFKHETKLNSKGEGIEFLKGKSFFEKLDQYIPKIKENPYLYKVLSWRNSEVSKYNKYIRDKIFGNPKDILVDGDFLMAYSSISDSFGYLLIVNSSEYIVKGVTPGKRLGIDGYYVNFYPADPDIFEKSVPIGFFVVDHNNQESLNKFKDELKRKLSIAKTLKGKAWIDYFKFKNEFLLMQDLYDGGEFLVGKDLDYGYSVTVHKSQGSTYETVFVDENDINRNRVPAERNQLKYVAFTRASKNVIVRNDELGSEKKFAETKEEKSKPRKAKLASGEIVDIIEHPTLKDISLTRKD
ncbi:MAG: AAA family ATPase, partial [Candidatus Pacearchaeota archaeon]